MKARELMTESPKTVTTAQTISDAAKLMRDLDDRQVEGRGVRDPAVLEAMRTVPRERFVPPDFARFAYEDRPLPIGAGQTISQPYIVAFMAEAAELRPPFRDLENAPLDALLRRIGEARLVLLGESQHAYRDGRCRARPGRAEAVGPARSRR